MKFEHLSHKHGFIALTHLWQRIEPTPGQPPFLLITPSPYHEVRLNPCGVTPSRCAAKVLRKKSIGTDEGDSPYSRARLKVAGEIAVITDRNNRNTQPIQHSEKLLLFNL